MRKNKQDLENVFLESIKKNISEEERKKFVKSLKNDLKRCRKGEKRKYNIHELLNMEESVMFLTIDSLDFSDRKEQEEQESYDFLNNEEEAKRAGWYSKKNDPIQLMNWCDKAYPNMNNELWTAELEKELLTKSF